MMSTSRRLAIISCVVLLLGCSESLSPTDIAGTYVLRRVANDPLPAVVWAENGVTIRVIAETLQFTPDSRGRLSSIRELESASGPIQPDSWVTDFTFRLVDDRIEVAFPCPPNADCVAPPHLVLHKTGDWVVADYAGGTRTPLLYARLP